MEDRIIEFLKQELRKYVGNRCADMMLTVPKMVIGVRELNVTEIISNYADIILQSDNYIEFVFKLFGDSEVINCNKRISICGDHDATEPNIKITIKMNEMGAFECIWSCDINSDYEDAKPVYAHIVCIMAFNSMLGFDCVISNIPKRGFNTKSARNVYQE